MTDLRDLIARAAYGGIEAYYSQPNDGMQKSEHDLVADAVLAVLADLPDEVIERFKQGWEAANERGETGSRVRAGFKAVFGGEQA